jgi:hypothetical protein
MCGSAFFIILATVISRRKNQWYTVSQLLLEQNIWQAWLLVFLPTKLSVLIKKKFFVVSVSNLRQILITRLAHKINLIEGNVKNIWWLSLVIMSEVTATMDTTTNMEDLQIYFFKEILSFFTPNISSKSYYAQLIQFLMGFSQNISWLLITIWRYGIKTFNNSRNRVL